MLHPAWRTRTRGSDAHPDWCGRGHHCTAETLRREHRSTPQVFDTPVGRVVATRIRTVAGADRMELRVVVDLPADAQQARADAVRIVTDVLGAVDGRVGVAR